MLENADWNKIEKMIQSFHKLERNWDGNESERPSTEIVNASIKLLYALYWKRVDLSPPIGCSVTPDGTIMIFWKNGSDYLEVEVEQSDIAQWMEKKEGQETKYWTQNL